MMMKVAMKRKGALIFFEFVILGGRENCFDDDDNKGLEDRI